MGLLPCSCDKNTESQSISNSNHLHSESSTSSISSQPSLPSVPSINPNEQETKITHYKCISTLKGHSSYVFSLALAGYFLFSGSSNGEILVWSRDFSTSTVGLCTRANSQTDNKCNEHIALGNPTSTSSAVKSLVISGDKLFSAHQDNKIRVWKIENNQLKSSTILPTLEDRILKSLSPKNYVRIRRHKKKTWIHHVDAVSALAISRDGSLLYSASWDRTFKIWRTSDFKCIESVQEAHDDAINAIALSKDGYVYTGSADTKIKVWKVDAGEKNERHTQVAALEKHKSAVNALALSDDDGIVLYSGSSDRSIVVWERDCGGGMVWVGALRGHTRAVLCLVAVGDLVCSGSADKTARVWRRRMERSRSYVCLAVLEGHQKPVKCLAAVVDGGGDQGGSDSRFVVYSGSLDCDIKVWELSIPFL